MWISQIRLKDDVIAAIRQVAEKRDLSINRTINDLLRAQLEFLSRCESGQYRSARAQQGQLGSSPRPSSEPAVDDGPEFVPVDYF